MMEKLLSVEQALAVIMQAQCDLQVEIIPLANAAGRVLAEDLAAKRTQPPFPASAMDGFALNARDIASLPAELEIVGESSAGHAFAGSLPQGTAIKIHTGAPVPEGADLVVPLENAETEGKTLRLSKAAESGAFVRPAGLDFKKGDVLLQRGTKLSARAIGLAAAMNYVWLPVYRPLRAAVLASGDELVRPGDMLAESQIISANHLALKAFLEARGAQVLDLPIARDNPASVDESIQSAKGEDLLITIGGVSVGGRDFIRPRLEAQGFEILFHGVAMQPGKPLLFGKSGARRVMGLPGNPVSALVAAEIFLHPLLALLSGEPATKATRTVRTMALAESLPENGARQAFLRAIYTPSGVQAFDGQDSAELALLAQADCLIIRSPSAPAAREGEEVEVLPLV